MNADSEAGKNDRPSGAGTPVRIAPGFMVGGKYVIKNLLGEGANGSVYEGEHSQIGHRVAIKIVHKALASRADIIARFQREARICGTIRNRNVGQVYDVGELPDGSPYMVMELHEGRSLAKVLAEGGPLPFSAALDVARQLLIGLQAAHEHSVVHRDVKPDNIMLVQESSGHMLVKLVDFGIGKSVSADIRSRNVTQEGVVVGSPDYMPPEQLKGEEVDHRVDLYAAGVVLYEMITGRVPFNAGSLTELFVAILRDPVQSPRVYRPDCPQALEQVIEKAMARDAAQRYQRASEMREALERVQREAGYSADGLTRYSIPPARSTGGGTPTRSAGSISHGDYALETERVRTAELKLPVKRAGTRIASIAAGLVVVGALSASLLRSGHDGQAHEVRPAATHAAAAAANPAVPPSAPAPSAAALPKLAEPSPAPTDVAAEPAVQGHANEQEPASEATQPPRESTARATAKVAGTNVLARDKHGHKPGAGDAPRERAEASKPAPNAAPIEPAQPAATQESPSDLVREASAAFVRGQMPRARALYREATERAPGNADAWRGLGMVSSRMGERGEAERALKRYLALRPNAPDAAAIQKKLAEL